MDEIKVGDVFKHNDFNIFVVVAGCRLRHLDDKIQIDLISDDGSAIYTEADSFAVRYSKIGHIGKFTEALKELEEMARNS